MRLAVGPSVIGITSARVFCSTLFYPYCCHTAAILLAEGQRYLLRIVCKIQGVASE
jgi:hypothetical protein